MKGLKEKLASCRARVGVIGMGYVGLPLAVEMAEKGFRVTGLDVDERKVRRLCRGRSYIPDVSSKTVARLVKAGRFAASTRFDVCGRCDVVVICVPTPLRKTKEPDLTCVVKACTAAAKRLRKGQLIVLESTTYPGTTRELVLPLFEAKGLKAGSDFFLAFSPERVDPANPTYGIVNTPKVVGGVTRVCGELAALFYGRFVERVVPVSSVDSAEMVKLLENTFRAVNIGLVNEIAQMCDRLGVDIWEIVGAAATKPFGFMPFYPGPGLGGHCIPVDPGYLAWKMKSLNFEPRFIDLASTINSKMPEYTVQRISRLLNDSGLPLRGSRIGVLGAAYKPDVNDMRESPSLDVMKLLMDEGAKVWMHDPFVPEAEVGGKRLRSKPLTAAALKGSDLVVILTAHSGIDYRRVLKLAPRVFDARNAAKGLKGRNLHRL